MNKKVNLRKYTTMAMFAALAFASLFVVHIGGIGGFLSFDVKDAIIITSAMIFGPISGAAIALIVTFVEMITISGTGIWGFLMNFISSATFAAGASALYRYMPNIKKTLAGAIFSLYTVAILMTGLMLLMNVIITPLYIGPIEKYAQSLETVKGLLVPLLLPFNLLKSCANASIVLVIYKPIVSALRSMKLINEGVGQYKFGIKSIVMIVVGLVLAAGCVAIMILSLGGHIQFGK